MTLRLLVVVVEVVFSIWAHYIFEGITIIFISFYFVFGYKCNRTLQERLRKGKYIGDTGFFKNQLVLDLQILHYKIQLGS